MLLGAAGNAHFAFTSDYTNETWFPEYDYAIGAAAGAETREASGVHRRAFANGLVLVNPTTGSVPVSFGGSYTGSGLTDASATTMAPHSALVLVKAGGGAPFQDGATGADGPASPAPGGGQPQSPSPPSGSPAPSPSPSGGTPPAPRAHRVAVKVRCRLARTCRGTIRLERAGRTVATRRVALRSRRSATLRLNVPAVAGASAAGRTLRLFVAAPRGVVAPRRVTLAV
jgi:hypothetical protein